MDSGNSGSMSSSGGDDQDLDIVSQPESVSGFLNSSHPTMQFGGSSDNNPNLFSQYQNHHQPSTLFDLSSNYLQALSQSQSPNSSNPNFLLNQRSDHEPNSTTNTGSDHQQANYTNSIANLPGSSSSAHQAPPISGTPRGSYSSAKPNNLVRNSKKRTRASRRAPTTVLTTDTSNFRAMVQEFTGIPAPPFSAGSSSYSRRLDSIFGSGSVYPLRPSAQKVHQTPFLSSSSSSSLLMSNSVSMVDASNIATSSTSHDMNNFNFTHQGLLGKQLPHHHNMMVNMQNPALSAFQSSLPHHHDQQQQPPPFLSSSINFGAKPNRDSTTLPLHPLEDQLGMTMSHGYLNNTNLGASDGSTMLPLRSDDNHTVRWRDYGLGLGAVSDGRGVLDQNQHLRPNLDHGIVNSSRSNTRGEASVDSWICPSD
ncbi:myb-like protein A isoform X1 [Rosa chinensis]|nr:myb-like protein A isoform X1 [Rosa chinensis]